MKGFTIIGDCSNSKVDEAIQRLNQSLIELEGSGNVVAKRLSRTTVEVTPVEGSIDSLKMAPDVNPKNHGDYYSASVEDTTYIINCKPQEQHYHN